MVFDTGKDKILSDANTIVNKSAVKVVWSCFNGRRPVDYPSGNLKIGVKTD